MSDLVIPLHRPHGDTHVLWCLQGRTTCPRTTWHSATQPSTGSWTLHWRLEELLGGTMLCLKLQKYTVIACTTFAVTTATVTWPGPSTSCCMIRARGGTWLRSVS